MANKRTSYARVKPYTLAGCFPFYSSDTVDTVPSAVRPFTRNRFRTFSDFRARVVTERYFDERKGNLSVIEVLDVRKTAKNPWPVPPRTLSVRIRAFRAGAQPARVRVSEDRSCGRHRWLVTYKGPRYVMKTVGNIADGYSFHRRTR